MEAEREACMQEILKIVLDKQTYVQGETMNITKEYFKWFTDTAYNIVFERFDNVFNDWVFHTAPVAGLAMTPLNHGESTTHVAIRPAIPAIPSSTL